MATATIQPTVLIGDIAPDFTAQTTEGLIHFHDWLGDSWCVFFSHPKDFTPVCTTELGRVAKLKPEFDRRKVKIMSLSVDSLENHKRWVNDINESQNTTVNYPMVADESAEIASLYRMIHPASSESNTVRAVFIIDPNKKIRLMITYPPSTGRNFDEILRVIDSLQLTDNHLVATPADWKWGQDCVILPSVKDPTILKAKFPEGWNEVKPYLRLTPQPKTKPIKS